MRWRADEIDFAKQLAAQGHSGSEIAKQVEDRFGRVVGAAAVGNILLRHDRDAQERRAADRDAAYYGRRALMRKLAADGASCAHIARTLGETVSSVEWAVPVSARSGAWVDKAIFRRSEFDRWLERQPGHKPYVESAVVVAAGKLFSDKLESECSWWIGDDSDGKMRFCAEPNHRPKENGPLASYCAAHCAQARVPTGPANTTPHQMLFPRGATTMMPIE